ncbi:MAG TPA: ATP-binding protein, partial [Archangium sp.]
MFSNVKGGVAANLGEKTLIVGPNGSGKSSVINAVELALAGFASDIAGREEMAKESDLQALAPGRTGELFSRAILDTGEECKWVAGAKGAKKAVHRFPEARLDPATVFPLRPVRDAIRGKPETARKFFIGFALPNLTKEDILSRIDAELHDNFRAATLNASVNDMPVDKLLIALEYAKKHARDTKSKGDAKAEVATAVAEGLPPLPTQEIMAALVAKRKDAQKKLEHLIAQQANAQQLQRMQSEAEPIRAGIQQALENVATLQAAIHQAEGILAQTPQPAFLDDHTQRVLGIIEHLARLEQTTGAPQSCPVCRTAAAHGTFITRYQAGQAFVNAEKAKGDVYQQALAQKMAVQANLTQWQTRAAQLQVQLDAVSAAIAAGSASAVPTEADVETAKAAITVVDEEITRQEAIKAQWEQSKKAKSAAADSKKESDKWKELYEACNTVVSELMDSGVRRFIERVQVFLPKSDLFDLQLREGEKQVFRFGLKRGDVLHTALSGAEWARVMGAISGACTPTDGKLS